MQFTAQAVLKAIGAGLVALGGADAITFSRTEFLRFLPFIQEICARLAFTGIILASEKKSGRIWELSDERSRIKVIGLDYDRPSISLNRVKVLI